MDKSDRIDSAAKVISIFFHPILMPVYGLLAIFTAPTVFFYLPFDAKRLMVTVFATTDILIPAALTPLLISRGVISSLAMELRGDRIVALIFLTILFSITGYLIHSWQIPLFLKAYTYSMAVLSLVLLVINMWWKISLHSAGTGILTGIVIYLSVRMSTPLLWYIAGSLLISGIVLSSRLKLNGHNPLQVYAGYFTGLAGIIILMVLFQ